MFNIGVDGQLILGALGATIAAIALEGQAAVVRDPPGRRSLRRACCPARSGASSPASSRRGPAPTRSSRPSCSTTSPRRSCFFALRSDDFLRPGSTGQPISKAHVRLRRHPADPRPAGDPPRLRLRRRAADGRGRVVVPVQDDEGLRAPRRGLQHDGRAVRGHERRRLDDARDGALGRASPAWAARSWSSARSPSCPSTSLGGIGFNAIALALLAGLRPSGVVLAALLFGALTYGRQVDGHPDPASRSTCSCFIMALVIMFVAAPGLIRAIWRRARSATAGSPRRPSVAHRARRAPL